MQRRQLTLWACAVALSLVSCAPVSPATLPTATSAPAAAVATATPSQVEAASESKLAWAIPTDNYATPEAGLALAAFESGTTI